MAEDLPEPASRKEEYLAKAAGMDVDTLPEPASREEQYLNAIAEGGGGGGGGSYTAGTGIEIEDKEISVDTDTIQEKMSAGDFVSILNNAISSSISKELTTADYDDDPSNPRCIILCNLPDGFYHKKGGVKIYVNQYGSIPFPYSSFWIMGTESDNKKYVFGSNPTSSDQHGSEVLRMFSVDTQNKQLLGRYSFLSSGDVVDNLTSTSTVYPLSANQGKALKDLIDTRSGGFTLLSITQAAYDLLPTKDPNTLYIITGA